MKRFAVAQAQRHMSEGGSCASAARELGVTDMSLRKWLDDAEYAPTAGQLARVMVLPEARQQDGVEARSAELRLDCPGGFVVRGLTPATAAELLRALS